MPKPEPLTIRDLRFSRWSDATHRPACWLDKGDLWLGAVIALFLAMLLSIVVEWKAMHLSRAQLGAVMLVVLSVGAVLFYWSILGETERGTWRLRKAQKWPKPPVPEGLPDDAVPCIAMVNTGSGTLPAEPGWVWLAEGMLHYRDEFMEFALRPTDVGELEQLLFLEEAEVSLPDGFPRVYLGLSPAVQIAGEVVKWSPGEIPLCDMAEQWKVSAPAGEPLFPPIEAAPPRKVTPWLASGAFAGVFLGGVLFAVVCGLHAVVPPTAINPRVGGLPAWVPYLPLIGFAVFRIPQTVLDLRWRKRRERELARLMESSD